MKEIFYNLIERLLSKLNGWAFYPDP
jgi:hypothetical protein